MTGGTFTHAPPSGYAPDSVITNFAGTDKSAITIIVLTVCLQLLQGNKDHQQTALCMLPYKDAFPQLYWHYAAALFEFLRLHAETRFRA